MATVKQVPGSPDAVLDSVDADHSYPAEDGVFTGDLVETWISYKRVNETDPVHLHATPHEFAMYYQM